MFLFRLPKHKAHKMLLKSTYTLEKAFIEFNQPEFETGQTKNSKKDGGQ